MSEFTAPQFPGLAPAAGNDSEQLYDRQVLPTPFHTRTAEYCRTNAWVDWNGFTVVSVYDDVTAEYTAIRNTAALSDVSPRIKYRVGGPAAGAYLDRLIAGPVADLVPGRSLHAVICDDSGNVIANGNLFHIESGRYALFVDIPIMDWLKDSAFGFDVDIGCITEDLAAFAIQGPTSCAVLLSAGFHGLDRLEPGAVSRFEVRGMPILISRTGETGDLGYELWLDPEDAPIVWDRVMDGGKFFGAVPCGREACEIARIEAGIPRVGLDYVPPSITVDRDLACTALELGLEGSVNLNGGPFNGRAALVRQAEAGPARRLLAFESVTTERLRPLAVTGPGGALGRVTSAVWSPRLSCTIGFVLARTRDISALEAVELKLTCEGGEVSGSVRGCRLLDRPIFTAVRARTTPPRAY